MPLMYIAANKGPSHEVFLEEEMQPNEQRSNKNSDGMNREVLVG